MRTFLALLLVVVVVSGCSSTIATARGSPRSGSSDARLLELTVGGMSCEGCAKQIENALGKRDGVRSAKVDIKAGRLVVDYEPAKTSPKDVAAVVASLGYTTDPSETADEWGRYPAGADVAVLSKAGEDTTIVEQEGLAPGKVTVVDFYADWCGPCKALDRRLAALVAAHPDALAVRKVNIVSWDTPVARRYLENVPYLPHVRIFGADGRLVTELSGADVEKIGDVIAALVRRGGAGSNRLRRATRRA